MISFLSGTLAAKNPAFVIIDKGGFGIKLFIPLSTFEQLGDIGSTVRLETHLHVKEDALTLFGFSGEEERELFLQLLSVSGVGPRLALGILSGAVIQDIYHYIAQGDENALVKIKGLGKKTAQRLILDLQAWAQKKSGEMDHQPSGGQYRVEPGLKEEAMMALTALGYSPTEADKAVSKVFISHPECDNVETIIRLALNS